MVADWLIDIERGDMGTAAAGFAPCVAKFPSYKWRTTDVLGLSCESHCQACFD
jgi:hypothetical protein